jgi:hypothetical protein
MSCASGRYNPLAALGKLPRDLPPRSAEPQKNPDDCGCAQREASLLRVGFGRPAVQRIGLLRYPVASPI